MNNPTTTNGKRMIYLDHAAATPLRTEVATLMHHISTHAYGNPGSFHDKGLEAKHHLDTARQTIATCLHAHPSELIFTGSGTESINLAIKGVAHALQPMGKSHIITTTIEHPAVTETCKHLEKKGFTITYLPVDKEGFVHPETIAKAITPRTSLVTISYANNEIGTIQDLPTISALCKERGVLFHTDASQAPAYLDIHVQHLGVHLMTLNSTKINGPKGVGLLYARQGTPLEPLIHGGGQEHHKRSGTENVAGIAGFAEALRLATLEREHESRRLAHLRDHLTTTLLTSIPGTHLNGPRTQKLPNNINITFPHIDAEALLLCLNEHGICASTGSACSTHKIGPSPILLAIGLSEERAQSTLRFTLGHTTTPQDIEDAACIITQLVKQLQPPTIRRNTP